MFETELSEPMLSPELREALRVRNVDHLDNQTYYRNLLRLQSEMIKLQDWVVANDAKILILCEGRDSAGKGGVIKRITQRLNPRVARVVALPKPPSANSASGISSAMCRICRLVVRSYCLTGHGIIAPVSNALWALQAKIRSNSFFRT